MLDDARRIDNINQKKLVVHIYNNSKDLSQVNFNLKYIFCSPPLELRRLKYYNTRHNILQFKNPLELPIYT